MSPRRIASSTSYASSSVYGAIDAKSCSRSHGQPPLGIAEPRHDVNQTIDRVGGEHGSSVASSTGR